MEVWLTFVYCASHCLILAWRKAIAAACTEFSRGFPTVGVMLTFVTAPSRSEIVNAARTL